MYRLALAALLATGLAACADMNQPATSLTTNVGAESGPRVTGGGAGSPAASGAAAPAASPTQNVGAESGPRATGGGAGSGNFSTGTPAQIRTRSRN
jgi:hypothetical protein